MFLRFPETNQLHPALRGLEMQPLESQDLVALVNQPGLVMESRTCGKLAAKFQYQHRAWHCKQFLMFRDLMQVWRFARCISRSLLHPVRSTLYREVAH